jgi:hypothetical protein
MVCRLGALAASCLIGPLGASAQILPTRDAGVAASSYIPPQDNAPKLSSDIRPGDWAYQALQNLLKRPGCGSPLAREAFHRSQGIPRQHAAILLNRCLAQIPASNEDLPRLLQLLNDEFANLSGAMQDLSVKLVGLEAQSFATSTKLKADATMTLGGIPNYGRNGSPNSKAGGNTTFNYEFHLNFYTSYTGKDFLRMRLGAGNFGSYPFGTSTSNVFKLIRTESSNDAPYLDRLYYQFPLGKHDQYRLTIGALVRNTEMAWIPSVYRSDVLDFFGTGGGSGVYNKALGEGVGMSWRQAVAPGKSGWLASLNTVVSGSAVNSENSSCSPSCRSGDSGADSSFGVFNAKSGINALAQLGYQATTWGVAIGYRYGTTQSAVRTANGVAGNPLVAGQQDNSLAFNLYWRPHHASWLPSVSTGFGYNIVSPSSAANAAQSSRSWMAGFQWDNISASSNVAGLAVGQPAHSAGATGGSPWLLEVFYRFFLSENLTITPALFYGRGVSTSKANDGGQPIFNGLGGVIQTTFEF